MFVTLQVSVVGLLIFQNNVADFALVGDWDTYGCRLFYMGFALIMFFQSLFRPEGLMANLTKESGFVNFLQMPVA